MYIKNRDEALDAVAEILDLPERRSQIIRCTVGIMQCLDADPRAFMCDCQILLIEGGLESLRRKRRDLIDSLEDDIPIVVLDPEEDRLFESLASAYDALRLSDIVREVFPEITSRYAPWEVARALLGREKDVQDQIHAALKVRKSGDRPAYDEAYRTVEALIISHHPDWFVHAPRLRQACRDVIVGGELAPAGQADAEADLVAALISASDERALPFLEKLDRDPQGAVETVGRIHDLSLSIRELQKEDADTPSKQRVA